MKQAEWVIQSDPEIMGGTPVFVGTRVPFQTLLDYLEAGQPLAEFLDDFPTVMTIQSSSVCRLPSLAASKNRSRN